jgi:hypothetical protein
MRGYGRKAAEPSEVDLFSEEEEEDPLSSISGTQSSGACLDDMFSSFEHVAPRARIYTPPPKANAVARAAAAPDGSPSASMKLFECIAGLSRPADRQPAAMRGGVAAMLRGGDAKGRKPKGRKPSAAPDAPAAPAATADWPSLREQLESLIDEQVRV